MLSTLLVWILLSLLLWQLWLLLYLLLHAFYYNWYYYDYYCYDYFFRYYYCYFHYYNKYYYYCSITITITITFYPLPSSLSCPRLPLFFPTHSEIDPYTVFDIVFYIGIDLNPWESYNVIKEAMMKNSLSLVIQNY